MGEEDGHRSFDARVCGGVRVAAIVFVVAMIVAAADQALIAPDPTASSSGIAVHVAERPNADAGERRMPGAHDAVESTRSATAAH